MIFKKVSVLLKKERKKKIIKPWDVKVPDDEERSRYGIYIALFFGIINHIN